MSQDKVILSVAPRELTGKQLKQLRASGFVPAVAYGAEQDPINLQVEMNPLLKVIAVAGTHTPIELQIAGGKNLTAIIKQVERDVVKRTPIAVDFQVVSADALVKTEVPIEIIDEDESAAKKAGLIILQDIERLEIKAKPADLPESLRVSAQDLAEHGDKLLIADIQVPTGVEILEENHDLTIASVYEPSAIAAANEAEDKKAEAEAAANAEPAEGEAEAAPAEGEANEKTE